MKKATILLLLLLVSCGSYNSINSFYNQHKDDANVTAIRVPQFMLTLLRNSSPEMNSFLGTVKDIRFMRLKPKNTTESNLINNQINNLTTNSFIEIFRKNEEPVRTLFSVREKKDVVKEIMVYKTTPNNSSVFYMNGNFDPNTVRQYAKDGKLEDLTSTLLQLNN